MVCISNSNLIFFCFITIIFCITRNIIKVKNFLCKLCDLMNFIDGLFTLKLLNIYYMYIFIGRVMCGDMYRERLDSILLERLVVLLTVHCCLALLLYIDKNVHSDCSYH